MHSIDIGIDVGKVQFTHLQNFVLLPASQC